jgi:hypothetical protein
MAPHSRNLNFRDASFKPYTTALGELALAWNDLHETLASLFWHMLPISNGLIPFAVWHSSKSDRAQRDMIRSLNDLRALGHDIPDPVRTEIRWLLGRIESLEDLRNDALHSPLLLSGDDVSPAHQLGHQRAKKFADKDLLFEFTWFYESAIALREYAAELSWHLSRPTRPPSLPERPTLPNRGETNGKPRPRQG